MRNGWWWIPNAEHACVAGRLDVAPGRRATLRLDGKLPGVISNEPGTHHLLWGYVETPENGYKKVTLVRVLHMEEHGINEHTGTTSIVKWSIMGAHLQVEPQTRVLGVRLHFRHAEDWLGQHAIPSGK